MNSIVHGLKLFMINNILDDNTLQNRQPLIVYEFE